MARRLNKKVALIGSAFFMVLVVIAVMVVLRLSRDPQQFIDDGDAAWAVRDYEKAERNYLRAKARSKDDELTVQVLLKLIDLYLETGKWPQTRGCWQNIVQIEPENLATRYIQLKYYYTFADNGAGGLWNEIEEQATGLLEIVERDNLMDEQTEQWERPIYKKADIEHASLTAPGQAQRIGPYLYLLRARAKLNLAQAGGVTDPEKTLDEAVADIKKARELDPQSSAAAMYQAQAVMVKGEMLASRGGLGQQEKALQEAVQILTEAVEACPDDPQAHINLLLVKQRLDVAGTTPQQRLIDAESDYQGLVDKFPSEARTYALLSTYYRTRGYEFTDKAIETVDKARQLDPNNFGYLTSAVDMRYMRFAINQDKSDMDAAIAMLQDSVNLPVVQETEGPKRIRNINNRAMLYSYLGTIYIEQLLAPDVVESDLQKQQWLGEAEQAVHELEQIFGSGEDPQVIKWQGMLELAQGKRVDGIRKLYAAYEQLKAAGRMDTQLAYILAKAFENSAELGAANEFWSAALRLRREDKGNRSDSIEKRKPAALLDCAQLWLKLRNNTGTLNLIDYYDSQYGANKRSQALRIVTTVETGDVDKAQELLKDAEIIDESDRLQLQARLLQQRIRNSTMAMERERFSIEGDQATPESQQEPIDTEALKAQQKKDYNLLADLIRQMLTAEPNAVPNSLVVQVCNYYHQNNQTAQAEQLARQFLAQFPENINIKLFLAITAAGSEPSQQQLAELQEKVREQIADPQTRAVNLGLFYQGSDKPEQAMKQFKAVAEPYLKDVEAQGQTKLPDNVTIAVSQMLDMSMALQDWQLCEKLAELIRVKDLDRCRGLYTKTRIAFAREDYDQALQSADEAVELRPVFGDLYALRASINAQLKKNEQSIEDFKTAAYLKPLDGNISRVLAFALYQRNLRLGNNVTSDQKIEVITALNRALLSNPSNMQLLGFYADYISDSEPEKALAIRQRMHKAQPTIATAVQLGNLASKIAQAEPKQKEKQALYTIAEDAFEAALKIDSANTAALYGYAKYKRSRGQYQQAEELLTEAQDKSLLGQHYFNTGQLDKAKQVFEQTVNTEPNNVAVIRMLLAIGQETRNPDDVQKYSQMLLDTEDKVEYRLMQIQAYMAAGLVKESELKLQSCREKYPDEPRAQLLDAWVSMGKGQLDKALELTNKSLEADEANPLAWRLRGQINRMLAKNDRSILDLNKSKSLQDNPVTRMDLARAYMAAQRPQDAVMELAAIMKEPKTPLEARLLLERIYYLNGQIDALRNFYTEMMEMFPDSVVWLGKSAGFAARMKDFATAESLYKSAWDKSVQSSQPEIVVFEGYLDSLLQSGKFDKLISQASRQVDPNIAPVALSKIAQAKMKMNDRQAAVDYFGKSVDTAGTNQRLITNILKLMYNTVGSDEVGKYCSQKLKENPDSLGVNYAMYQLARIEKDYNKAATYLDKTIEITGPQTNDGVQYRSEKAQLLFIAYKAYSDNSYLKRAIEGWEELLQELPDNPTILNNLAYTLASNDQQLKKALEYAQKTVEQSPNNAAFLDTCAYALYKNGRFKEAVERAQAAVQQYELKEAYAPAAMYEHLAMIKEKLGANDEAVAAYKKALEFGKEQYSQSELERINLAVERLLQ